MCLDRFVQPPIHMNDNVLYHSQEMASDASEDLTVSRSTAPAPPSAAAPAGIDHKAPKRGPAPSLQVLRHGPAFGLRAGRVVGDHAGGRPAAGEHGFGGRRPACGEF